MIVNQVVEQSACGAVIHDTLGVTGYASVQGGIAGEFETAGDASLPLPHRDVTSAAETWLQQEYADWGQPNVVEEHVCSFTWRGPAERYKVAGKTVQPCQKPILFSCVKCPEYFLATCNSKDASVCEPCELRYRTRVRAVLRLPMLASRPGSVFLFTLTAPGSRRHCLTHVYQDKDGKTQPSVRCSWDEQVDVETGKIVAVPRNADCIECVCSNNNLKSRDDIAQFNSELAAKWNRFMTYVRRFSPDSVNGRSNKARRPFADFQYAKAIEPQKRGALHIHALIRTASPLDERR